MSKPPCLCSGRNDIRCNDEHCDLAGTGRHQCGICHRFLTSDAYNRAWGGKGVKATSPSCTHLGPPRGEEVFVPTCPNGTQGYKVPLLGCGIHGETTGWRGAPGKQSCYGCRQYEPDTFRLVAPAGTKDAPACWEGRAPKKPWQYRVTACIPHLNTPESLPLVIETLRRQAERPYILLVDTGSDSATCRKLEQMRAEDCEVHYVRAHGYINSSAPVTVALDLSVALCRSEYLYTTHSDVFLINRGYIGWLLAQCGPACPAVGYEMSPRSWATDQWRGMVSHTASLFHVPTVRRLGATWNMEHGYELADWTGRPALGWPDTETGFNLTLRKAGVVPRIIAPEENFKLHRDGNLIHVRSYPGTKVYDAGGGYHATAAGWMRSVLEEVRALVRQWDEGERQEMVSA